MEHKTESSDFCRAGAQRSRLDKKMMRNQTSEVAVKGAALFQSTMWTQLIEAGAGKEEALAYFCESYWLPLYTYARRSLRSSHEAEDVTQDFFIFLMQKEQLAKLEREKGRFRNFLLILFKRFMLNDYHKKTAQKRGGHLQKVDFDEVESFVENNRDLSPEESYAKAWALNLLNQVMGELAKRFSARGEDQRWRVMKPFLEAQAELSQREAAFALSMTENAFSVALYRLRKEFASTLRRHVGESVTDLSELEAELRFLMEVLEK